jgi:hypothetical protein
MRRIVQRAQHRRPTRGWHQQQCGAFDGHQPAEQGDNRAGGAVPDVVANDDRQSGGEGQQAAHEQQGGLVEHRGRDCGQQRRLGQFRYGGDQEKHAKQTGEVAGWWGHCGLRIIAQTQVVYVRHDDCTGPRAPDRRGNA